MYRLTWFHSNDYWTTKLYYTREVGALSERDIRQIGDGAWVTILTFLYYMYCSHHSLTTSLYIYMGSIGQWFFRSTCTKIIRFYLLKYATTIRACVCHYEFPKSWSKSAESWKERSTPQSIVDFQKYGYWVYYTYGFLILFRPLRSYHSFMI